MDIEEIRKLARNKIEADALTKQVWEKQNLQEGFKETFKPLIESQDSVKKALINSKTK